MSSEAAQKAYPDWGHDPHGMDAERRELQRFAFDRGAVEALKQAAAQVDTGSAEWVRLMNMADEWEVGQ